MSPSKHLPFTILIGNELLATFKHEVLNYHPKAYYSIMVCCSGCGDVWARIITPGFRFFPAWGECAAHAPIWLGGGSLVDNVSTVQFLRSWPASVWKREVNLWAEQVADWGDFALNLERK